MSPHILSGTVKEPPRQHKDNRVCLGHYHCRSRSNHVGRTSEGQYGFVMGIFLSRLFQGQGQLNKY